MNSSMQLFDYGGQQVRVTLIDGEPWFVGKDIASVLGYSNTRDALRVHVDDEDKQTLGNLDESRITTPLNNVERSMTIINESGVYSLIFSSQLPTAKKFKHWVTAEVLPAIRKTGSYSMPQKKEQQTVQQEKEKPALPATSAPIKAADKIFSKMFKAKSNEDFEAVLALDKAFQLSFGISAITDIAGYEVIKRYDHYCVHNENSGCSWIDWENPHYVLRKAGEDNEPDENGYYFNYININRC